MRRTRATTRPFLGHHAELLAAVLRETAAQSCEYRARCDVTLGGVARSATVRVVRNASGFYGTAELSASAATCMLHISTATP